MKVRHQNAWPSLNLDFLSILDRMQWAMPVGFYYKALHRPKFLWGLAQRVIRRIGGLGKIDINQVTEIDYHHRYHHTDVAVVGGGPAGLSAALAAAEQGASVTLVDDQPALGGSLRMPLGQLWEHVWARLEGFRTYRALCWLRKRDTHTYGQAKPQRSVSVTRFCGFRGF